MKDFEAFDPTPLDDDDDELIVMAPTKATTTATAATAPYAKEERVLCFHHEMLYEAKVLDCKATDDGQSWQYKIHYKGWKNT